MGDKQETVIVIFDDVKENLYELASVVDELGFVAKPVHTIRQAVRALSSEEISLLLLDIAMPEMSGFDFLRWLKKNKEWEDLPVVFVSAYIDMETKTEAFSLGAEDYIVRPFDREECACRIRQAVKRADGMKQMRLQREHMLKLLAFKGQETKEAKCQVIEAVIAMSLDEKTEEKHLERIRQAAVHFAKGLSVIPEYETRINDKFIELLKVAAPLYCLGKSPLQLKQLEQLHRNESKNEYLAMGLEIAKGFQEEHKTRKDRPLSSQIVSLVVAYDTIYGGHKEKIELIKREAGRCHNPVLVHAFGIIQCPYYLDKEGEYEVSL